FYFVFEQNILRKTLLKYFSFSGIVITILYSPWIPTTLRMLQKTKHWNPKPKSDFFLSLFNRFFASEPYLVVIFTALILLLLFYFISIRKNDPAHVNETDPAAGTIDLKLHLSIPVLFSWMFFTLFIPYFRSLVTVPMYYPKYAIGTLPVIMVMAAMCIILFKNRTFKALLIASIVLVSLTSLFLSVEYYNKVRKQNWRGTAEYVLKQSAQKYPNKEIFILTEHPELYRFYFDSLEPKVEQIRELPKLPGKLKRALKNLVDRNENIGIWLLPGHKFKPAKSVTAFLDQHFIQLEKKNLGLGEAVLYEPQKEKKIPDTHQ
ncbi:MAG: hypothetical protein GY940_33955, partial [bacterium]|nr:hypothetical protein [bacterium]